MGGTTAGNVDELSVSGESAALCVNSLFNDSVSSERKNVVVFPADVSLDVLALVVVVVAVGAGTVRDFEIS